MNKKAHIIAGISLLLMTVIALFTYGYIHSTFLASPDEVIYQSSSELTLGLIGWSFIIILDFIVAWAFYECLKHVNLKVSLLNMILRILYTFILMVAVYQIATIVFSLDSLSLKEIASYNQAFENIWSYGLIVFGIHLTLTGYLSIKSKKIPSFWGYLISFAGLCYIIVHSLKGLNIDISLIETILSLPMMIGELGFGLWLLIKGRKLL